ncbi:hypothetical protein [Paludibacterium sp.]|nr:hypothetical protein [Paludibacterium sp.]MBV8649761.1 hypothetical protein [Paludibacterium sp.]
MDEHDADEPLLAPSKDNLDLMSAMEREAFADSIRDEWDQDSYLVA